jgi:hypothetical protein
VAGSHLERGNWSRLKRRVCQVMKKIHDSDERMEVMFKQKQDIIFQVRLTSCISGNCAKIKHRPLCSVSARRSRRRRGRTR